jgi:hypothetical protein
MSVAELLGTLQQSAVAAAVRGDIPGSEWLFPIVETAHVLALAVVFGSVAMVDLRLLGLGGRGTPVRQLAREVLPWTWTAFVLAAAFGTLMFVSKAGTYFHNHEFRMKFLAMFLAGANMLVFQLGAFRRAAEWEAREPPPAAARIAGALSLLLWMLVIFYGRWVGFTT